MHTTDRGGGATVADLGGSPSTTLSSLGIALLGGAIAAFVVFNGWHGGDLPAQVYRQTMFRSFGFIVWDGWWYAGHYWLTYSVLAPALTAVVGLPLAALGAATISAWAFDRLLVERAAVRGTTAVRWASVLFAVNTAAPIIIGQVTFLLGEAVGLLALLAAMRRRPLLTVVLALACSLFSPVAGVFLVLALVAWMLSDDTDRVWRGAAVAAAVAPMVVSSILFREFGQDPFPVEQLAVVLACCVAGLLLFPARERALRWGCVLYAAGSLATFVVPNPLGGNLTRLAACVAAPLALATVRADRRKVAAVAVGLLVIWQWAPAVGALVGAQGDPSRNAAYFTPLTNTLAQQPGPTRVEIPFTNQHWEAAYVAPHVSLARGWERQLDQADNALFYSHRPLTAAAYKTWLDANGISWVALPDVPLDFSSVKEAALIRSGLPYLHLVWSNRHWRLWRVVGSPGLVTGPARLTMPGPDRLVLAISRPGTVTVRVRYTAVWHVTEGYACVRPDAAGWTTVHVDQPGRVELAARPGATSHDCERS